MFLVSRINTLRRISGKEIAVKNQSGRSLQNGNTFVFRYAGTDSRFIDHDIASAQDLPYRFTGRIKRCQVRAMMQVDRRRDRHNVIITFAELFRIGRTKQSRLTFLRNRGSSTDLNNSSDTSCVASRPSIKAATRSRFTSYPTTG